MSNNKTAVHIRLWRVSAQAHIQNMHMAATSAQIHWHMLNLAMDLCNIHIFLQNMLINCQGICPVVIFAHVCHASFGSCNYTPSQLLGPLKWVTACDFWWNLPVYSASAVPTTSRLGQCRPHWRVTLFITQSMFWTMRMNWSVSITLLLWFSFNLLLNTELKFHMLRHLLHWPPCSRGALWTGPDGCRWPASSFGTVSRPALRRWKHE